MESEDARKTREASEDFLVRLTEVRADHACVRATVWGSVHHRLATGEGWFRPSLDQPQGGLFLPDDASVLEALAGSANFVSIDGRVLYPVGVVGVQSGAPMPHFRFEVRGPAEDSEEQWGP